MPKRIPHHNNTKLCGKCKVYKQLSDFSKDKSKWDGFTNCCKECRSGFIHRWKHSVDGSLKWKENRKRWRQKLRLMAFCKYSLKCDCCGEDRYERLTIDHINGGGKDHKRKVKYCSIYHWLFKNNYPKGFRTLCWNCNCCLGAFGYCAHKKPNDLKLSKYQRHDLRLKNLVISNYGGKCKCCGESRIEFLTIDHINNNGAEHRKITGGGSKMTYRWLKKNNFPSSFQVLCFGCNYTKKVISENNDG